MSPTPGSSSPAGGWPRTCWVRHLGSYRRSGYERMPGSSPCEDPGSDRPYPPLARTRRIPRSRLGPPGRPFAALGPLGRPFGALGLPGRPFGALRRLPAGLGGLPTGTPAGAGSSEPAQEGSPGGWSTSGHGGPAGVPQASSWGGLGRVGSLARHRPFCTRPFVIRLVCARLVCARLVDVVAVGGAHADRVAGSGPLVWSRLLSPPASMNGMPDTPPSRGPHQVARADTAKHRRSFGNAAQRSAKLTRSPGLRRGRSTD